MQHWKNMPRSSESKFYLVIETKAFQSKAGQIDLTEETQTLDYAKTLISTG